MSLSKKQFMSYLYYLYFGISKFEAFLKTCIAEVNDYVKYQNLHLMKYQYDSQQQTIHFLFLSFLL